MNLPTLVTVALPIVGRARGAVRAGSAARRMAWGLVGVLVAAGSAVPLDGQTVRGRLSEAETGIAIQGALVALLSVDRDSVHAGVITDSSGAFVLAAAPGRWRLRAERIGHGSILTEPIELAATSDTTIFLEAPVEALRLGPLDVTTDSRGCAPRVDGGATAALWEETRKALENAIWASEQDLMRYDALLHVRRLDPRSLEVRDETTELRRGAGSRPFSSVSPERLRAGGYVERTDSGTYYFAPDERVLLSDAFLDGHCFGVRRSDRDPELVGLSFEPLRGSSNVDIAGVLWLDETSRELRFLEYRYVNLRVSVPTDRLGGEVRFQRLPSGAWIARRWWIRMPEIVVRRVRRMGREVETPTLAGLRQRGGEVVAVETRTHGRIAELDRPRVQGVVFDSTRGTPLSSARVFLIGTEFSTHTDTHGRFMLVADAGDFSLAFHHPRIDSVGFQPPPLPIRMRSGVVRQARLAVPGEATLVRIACARRGNGGVVAGTVHGATGEPVPDARVELAWTSRTEGVRSEVASSDEAGRFLFCDAPVGPELHVHAAHRGRTSRVVTVPLVDGTAVGTELQLDAMRPGRVVGQVVDAASGAPVARAEVRVHGVALQTSTDRDGRFELPYVPAGPQRVVVTHLAFGTHGDTIRVLPDSTTSVSIGLTATAIVLEPLTVTAERQPLTPGLAEFYDRMDDGLGYFVTAEQIARRQARGLSEVLRAVPGLTVTCGSPDALGSGCLMQFERARAMDIRGRERVCPVQYFLDGTRTAVQIIESIRPAEIEGIEVYNGLADTPPRFRRGPDTRCGVIAVWLKERG